MVEKSDLVSVIIPVYNVYSYLDECLESVVRQTYKNIEIILVDDGSTDGSEKKCDDWEKRDIRIKCYHKNNEGLGPTRNYGIDRAVGNYIVCIDSDDWIDRNFIEKLYEAIIDQDAEVAECYFYRISVDSGVKSICVTNDFMKQEFTKRERMIYGNNAQWKMMTTKKFRIIHKLQQPAFIGEDVAIYPLMIALAERVASVNQPLYFYRKGRKNSLSTIKSNFADEIKPLQYAINQFIKRGLFHVYEEELYKYIIRWSSRFLVPIIDAYPANEYYEIKEKFISLLKNNFSFYKNRLIVTLGGFNLSRIVQKSNFLEDPYLRFQFTSISAIMHSQSQSQNSTPPPGKKMYIENLCCDVNLNRIFGKY